MKWLDHEAYAWASILPETVQAVVVANDHGAKLIIGGSETVEIGTYTPVEFTPTSIVDESMEARISRAILDEAIAAAVANFADVDTIALDDATGQYRHALTGVLPNTISLVPFTLAIAPERTPWALACGVAQRALQPDHRRLHVNFAESRSPMEEATNRVSRYLSVADVGTLAAGAVLAVALIGWRSETTHELMKKAAAFEARVLSAKQQATLIDEDVARVATARAVLERIEETQRSAPVIAREIAAIVDRMDARTSATTLGGEGRGWTLSGHAQDAAQVAQLMTAVQAGGFESSLTSTEQQGSRLAYSISLDLRQGGSAGSSARRAGCRDGVVTVKVRIVPLAIAVLLPFLAYYFYITPTNATVAALEQRIALAQTQADTIASASLIEPRVARERADIAARLGRVQVLSVPNAEARFLADTARLADTSGVRLTSVLSKGKAAPFGSAAPPVSALPAPGATIVPPPGPRRPLAVQSVVDGIALSRTMTISGSLLGILRFLDGLGSLATPVLLKSISLGQGDRLQATLDCDLVIVDPSELREAKRGSAGPLPAAGSKT